MLIVFFLLIFGTQARNEQEQCSVKPYEAKGDPADGSNSYMLEINATSEKTSDISQGFQPGETYKVSIRGWRNEYTVKTFRGFVVTALFEDGAETSGGAWQVVRGHGDARVAPGCRRAGVSHANLRSKTSVHMMWKAPDVLTSNCIIFKASVIETKYVWFTEADRLTVRFCAKKGAEAVKPIDDISAKCCACDIAHYELEFTGIWSKNTHPKDYPTLEHLTHFTDMLATSHSASYSLWTIGGTSTDGMKEIAEWGNTYKAEAEAKEKASEVRSLMKIKGLWFPEVQGVTRSHFVVNKYHHFASLATMFGPSPDWCVGLSAVNLCLPDCTWVEERVLELQPFDAGTDSGPTYMSPNSPTEPREPIHWITTKLNPESPFYNDKTDIIPTMAKIVLRRKKVTQSTCRSDDEYRAEAHNITNTSEDEEYADRRECMMTQWEPWSLCSATCGKGIRIRSRVYVFPIKAQVFMCHRQTSEKQFCNAKINECVDSEAFSSTCQVSSWGSWGECSVACGHGERARNRTLLNPSADCPNVELTRKDRCIGENGENCDVTPNPLCKTTSWSDWSPCSASCDEGVKVRTRLFFYAEHEKRCLHVNLQEKDSCSVQSCRRFIEINSEEICQEEKQAGQCGGSFPRYWYNSQISHCERFIFTGCKGNRNQFETEEECKQICVPGYEKNKALVPNQQLFEEFGHDEQTIMDGGARVDCEVSKWTAWGGCSVSCGRGKKQRTRQIVKLPRNGGNRCSEHMIQELQCRLRPCPVKLACQVGPWSRWSTCSVTCGAGVQTRKRRVIRTRNDDWEEIECAESETDSRKCTGRHTCY